MILLLLRRPDTPSITRRWSKGDANLSIAHYPSESSREKSRTTGWKPVCRTGPHSGRIRPVANRMPMFLSIQLRENFRVAHIGPFSSQLERQHFFAGLREIANRVGQFVLTAR